MYLPSDISNLYKINYVTLISNLKKISSDQSLMLPQPAGNCVNWILGHILVSRDIILTMLGQDPILSDIQSVPYKRGTIPHKLDILLPFDALKDVLKQSQNNVTDSIEILTEEELTSGDPDSEIKWQQQPLSDKLVFLQFHEAYHIGQIGLSRRLIGLEGAIQ